MKKRGLFEGLNGSFFFIHFTVPHFTLFLRGQIIRYILKEGVDKVPQRLFMLFEKMFFLIHLGAYNKPGSKNQCLKKEKVTKKCHVLFERPIS